MCLFIFFYRGALGAEYIMCPIEKNYKPYQKGNKTQLEKAEQASVPDMAGMLVGLTRLGIQNYRD